MASTSLSVPLPTRLRPFNSRFPTSLMFCASSIKQSSLPEHGSGDHFLQNNSLGHFLRFKKGMNGGSNGELQTAVVTYRKKFPWSLLRPFLEVPFVVFSEIMIVPFFFPLLGEFFFSFFLIVGFAYSLQVDLVSTVHIADKEYVCSL